MNRNFENKAVIKALNMYGRVPETWELLEEIEKLNNIINELEKYCNENINFPIGCGITSDYGYAFENVLDKLKELKEKNNDNNKDNR